jgi:chemotaxis protein CheD
MYFKKSAGIYGKPVKVIHAGEWHVSQSDEMILTILGSCVAVCIHDPVNRISGMNHFMLPGHVSKSDIFKDRTTRYGITAMKVIIQKLIDIGAEKSYLRAMIFGGGTMLDSLSGNIIRDDPLPLQNVRIAKLFIELEDIPLERADTGGTCARKIMMDVQSGKVFLRKSGSTDEIRQSLFLTGSPRVPTHGAQ